MIHEAPEACVGLRVSPNVAVNDMGEKGTYETYRALAKEVSKRPGTYLHVTGGYACGHHELDDPIFAEDIREVFPGYLIWSGENELNSAAKLLDRGVVDVVAFGRLYMSNPDLALHISGGKPLMPPPQPYYWYTGGREGYVDLYTDQVLNEETN